MSNKLVDRIKSSVASSKFGKSAMAARVALENSLKLDAVPPSTMDIYNAYRQSPQRAYEIAYPGMEVTADSVYADDGTLIGTIAHVASDSNELLMSREALLSAQAKVIEKQYPELKLAAGKIIPIDNSMEGMIQGYNGTEVYQIQQIDYIGSMELIGDYSKGGPNSEVVGEKKFVTSRVFGGQIGFSLMEILRTLGAGLNLPDAKFTSIKKSYLKYINAVGYFGDARGGLQGLLTLSGTTNYTVTLPISYGVDADYLTSLLADIAATIPEITNGIENPTRLVTPLRVREIAMATYRSGVNLSVYEEFMARERMAGRITEWVVDDLLKFANNGQPLCLLVHDEMDKLCMKNPQPLTFLDAQQQNYTYTVHAFATTCGVNSTAPASVMKITDIYINA